MAGKPGKNRRRHGEHIKEKLNPADTNELLQYAIQRTSSKDKW
jgi:hypothetical protein